MSGPLSHLTPFSIISVVLLFSDLTESRAEQPPFHLSTSLSIFCLLSRSESQPQSTERFMPPPPVRMCQQQQNQEGGAALWSSRVPVPAACVPCTLALLYPRMQSTHGCREATSSSSQRPPESWTASHLHHKQVWRRRP